MSAHWRQGEDKIKIVTVQYDNTFKKLFSVYKKSIELNIPDAELIDIHVPFPENTMGRNCFCHHNHAKLLKWVEYMETCQDNVIFTDADMLALRDPVEIWDADFDICYTERTHTNTSRKIPLNGGVVFVKPTEKAREFLRLWAQIDGQMYNDAEFHAKYIRKYVGMNQASLGYLIEHPELYTAKLLPVHTRKYNAVECDWRYIDNTTAFVHIKSSLRAKILTGKIPIGHFKTAMIKWKEIKCKL